MGFPFVEDSRLAEGVGNAPTSALSRSCFRDRCSQVLAHGHHIFLPAVDCSGWRESHPRPPGSEPGRLLLTLHPENGCQGWTRTNTERLNRPPCYFHTTWQWRCRQDWLPKPCKSVSPNGTFASRNAVPPASFRLERVLKMPNISFNVIVRGAQLL